MGRNGPWVGGKLDERPSRIFRGSCGSRPIQRTTSPRSCDNLGDDAILPGDGIRLPPRRGRRRAGRLREAAPSARRADQTCDHAGQRRSTVRPVSSPTPALPQQVPVARPSVEGQLSGSALCESSGASGACHGPARRPAEVRRARSELDVRVAVYSRASCAAAWMILPVMSDASGRAASPPPGPGGWVDVQRAQVVHRESPRRAVPPSRGCGIRGYGVDRDPVGCALGSCHERTGGRRGSGSSGPSTASPPTAKPALLITMSSRPKAGRSGPRLLPRDRGHVGEIGKPPRRPPLPPL